MKSHNIFGILMIFMIMNSISSVGATEIVEDEFDVANCNRARSDAESRALAFAAAGWGLVIYGHAPSDTSWIVVKAQVGADGAIIGNIIKYIYNYQSPNNCNDGDEGKENVSFYHDVDTGTWEKKQNPEEASSQNVVDTLLAIRILILVGAVLFLGSGNNDTGEGGGNCLVSKIIANLGSTFVCW